jgi:hypothetical protein
MNQCSLVSVCVVWCEITCSLVYMFECILLIMSLLHFDLLNCVLNLMHWSHHKNHENLHPPKLMNKQCTNTQIACNFTSNHTNRNQWTCNFPSNDTNRNQWTCNFTSNHTNRNQWTCNFTSNRKFASTKINE